MSLKYIIIIFITQENLSKRNTNTLDNVKVCLNVRQLNKYRRKLQRH